VRGRIAPELLNVMGYFVNLVPVPFDVDLQASLTQFLQAVRHDMSQAMDNQEIPFVTLASHHSLAARARSGGIYQALFSFQDARERKRHWGALDHASIPLFQKGAQEDIGLWLMEGPGGLDGGLTYNADLYLRETALALRDRYLAVLRRIAADPAASLATLTAVEATPAAAPALRASCDGPVSAAPGADKTLSTEHERRLAAIWANVLGIDADTITSRDNFFDLGGHSLLLGPLAKQLADKVGVRVGVLSFFEYPTVSALAKMLGDDGTDDGPVARDRQRADGRRRLSARRTVREAGNG
jgi:acyl carrier protein